MRGCANWLARRPDCQTGFTLIEVMIAIVIMAMISLIAWRGLDSVGRANATIRLHTEESARLMRALQQIERDIAWRATTELPSAATDMPQQDEEGDAADQQNVSRSPGRPQPMIALLPPGMEIRRGNQTSFFIGLVRAAPAAPGRWQRVQWWLRDGTLYRAAGEAANQYPIPAPQSADRMAVLEGVSRFDIRAWEPGRGWLGLPVGSRAQQSASGLEVTLAIPRGPGPAWQYRRVIALD